MRKVKNGLILAMKGLLFIYLPIILSIYFIYKIIFKIDMGFAWDRILIYSFVLAISSILSYSENTKEEDVQDFKSLKNSITKGKWEIAEESENRLVVKPKFDFPFRLLINDKVEINYAKQKAIIKGPEYYLKRLVKDINETSKAWLRRTGTSILLLLFILLIFMPLL